MIRKNAGKNVHPKIQMKTANKFSSEEGKHHRITSPAVPENNSEVSLLSF
jgi:hypothetical protein